MIYLLVWLFLMVFCLYSGPLVCGVGLAIMMTGIPAYFLGVYWENKPRCVISTIGEAADLGHQISAGTSGIKSVLVLAANSGTILVSTQEI